MVSLSLCHLSNFLRNHCLTIDDWKYLVKDYNNDLIEKRLLARMPWHDVSVGMAGKPARDVARHFVQRWNFVKSEKGMKKSHMKFLTPKGEFVSTRNEFGWTGSQKVQILRSSTLWSQGVDLERSIQDAYLSSIENAEHFIYIENQFFGKSMDDFVCDCFSSERKIV